MPERAARLEALGYEVDGAVPGTSIGIKALRNDPPDAFVVDLAGCRRVGARSDTNCDRRRPCAGSRSSSTTAPPRKWRESVSPARRCLRELGRRRRGPHCGNRGAAERPGGAALGLRPRLRPAAGGEARDQGWYEAVLLDAPDGIERPWRRSPRASSRSAATAAAAR